MRPVGTTLFETSSNAYNGELLDQEIFINPQLVNVHEDCQNARIYVLDVLEFLSRHISSKGFLRRLVHSQYHDNGKTNTTNRIDRAFFHSCTDIISFMRHISHVQSQGDSKDTKFLDDLSTHLYTTLAKINAALSTPSFLTITGDLLQHNDVLVRKTALSMFIEKIEDVQGKKIVSINKNDQIIKLDNIDVVSINYGFQPNNDIAKILGLKGFFNKHKNYYQIKKNFFNQTSNENVYIIGEAARNAGSKISFYEGQLTGFLLNNDTKTH